jgi:Spy/CpxP family protein refolding chaperone
MGMLRSLDLSSQQMDKIRNLLQQFRAAHPDGSADAASRQQLRQNIEAVLTADQRAKLAAERARMRAERAKRAPGGPTPQPQASSSPSP